MPAGHALSIYVSAPLRQRLRDGRHNFLGHVVAAFEAAGWVVTLRDDSDDELLRARTRDEYSLVHLIPPVGPNGLTFRLAYVFPFWKIEATGTRWEFESTRTAFDPDQIDTKTASSFVRSTRKRLFDAMPEEGSDIIIPLQGRLLQKRAHQQTSPLEMVAAVINYFPETPIKVIPHPREDYTPDELSALSDLCAGRQNVMATDKPARQLIPSARMVVTQNSGAAFEALFFNKPAVLFARSDFHHIASNVEELGVAGALEAANKPAPDGEKYLYWFLQINALNAGRSDIQTRILDLVRAHGWPV